MYLPDDYKISSKILLKVLKNKKLQGFDLWPISEYINQNGLNDFSISMELLYHLTQSFTSEFAIRPFLIKNQSEVLNYFNKTLGAKYIEWQKTDRASVKHAKFEKGSSWFLK